MPFCGMPANARSPPSGPGVSRRPSSWACRSPPARRARSRRRSRRRAQARRRGSRAVDACAPARLRQRAPAQLAHSRAVPCVCRCCRPSLRVVLLCVHPRSASADGSWRRTSIALHRCNGSYNIARRRRRAVGTPYSGSCAGSSPRSSSRPPPRCPRGPLAGCGGDAPTAGAAGPAPASRRPQAVDRLVRHPRAVDPSAGVPAGSSGVVASARTRRCRSRARTREIRRELARERHPLRRHGRADAATASRSRRSALRRSCRR